MEGNNNQILMSEKITGGPTLQELMKGEGNIQIFQNIQKVILLWNSLLSGQMFLANLRMCIYVRKHRCREKGWYLNKTDHSWGCDYVCISSTVAFRVTHSCYSKSVSDHLIFCFSSFPLPLSNLSVMTIQHLLLCYSSSSFAFALNGVLGE